MVIIGLDVQLMYSKIVLSIGSLLKVQTTPLKSHWTGVPN